MGISSTVAVVIGVLLAVLLPAVLLLWIVSLVTRM